MESPRDIDGPLGPNSASSSLSPPAKRRRPPPALSDCCRTCRLRKVKCTGNVGNGPCTNCSRLELTCSFVLVDGPSESSASRTTPSHSHTEAGTLRKRAQRACSQCHAHKTKCSGDLPRCKRCESANLLCEYTPAKRKFTNVRFHSPNSVEETHSTVAQPSSTHKSDDMASPSGMMGGMAAAPILTSAGNFPLVIDTSILNAEEMLFRRDLLLRHMDAYLDHLYSLPSLGFLHPESTYRKIQDGTFPPAQAAALCAIASFFVSPGEAGREFGMKCSDQVDMHLFHNLQMFSEDMLILFALNITFNLLSGSFAKVWQCFGVATRLMVGLQVNWDVVPRNQSFMQQESLRRVAWQIFTMDRLLAGGYEEYISCRAENMKIRLPCDEMAFRENRAVIAERLHDKPGRSPNTVGLHGYLIRLVDLQHRIQVTTKKLTAPTGSNRSHLEPSKVMADINGLQNELTRFHSSVPDELRLSDQSISRYMASQDRPGYVFLHTHLSACHTDLYRFSLPGQREQASLEVLRKLPRDFVVKSQRQAVAHSMCTARFCEAIQKEMDKQPNTGKIKLAGDYTIFHMAARCLQVLLIALQNNLYQDLETDTTAPLWRHGPTDEARVRDLIEGLHRITEPWCEIFTIAQQTHDGNMALLEEFDRNQKIADQRSPARYSDATTSGSSQLPGPDFMLENLHGEAEEEARRNRSTENYIPGQWIRAPPGADDPNQYHVPEVGVDLEFGPPGLPLFLAQARSAALSGSGDVSMAYEAGNTMMDMPGLNGMMPDEHHMMSSGAAMPSAGMNGGSNPALYQQIPHSQPTHPAAASGFMPPQQGIFMGGYPGQYADGHGGSTGYMQQGGY